MNKRDDIIKKMREDGLTYETIGNYFGISRQRVHQILHPSERGDRFREESVHKIKYIGLRNWMLENRISISRLCKMTGKTNLYHNLVGLYDVHKSTIDAILSVTGLTYEECFKEEEITS